MEPKLMKDMLKAMDVVNDQVEVCTLELKEERPLDQLALAEAFGKFIADFPNASGWLCRQSDVMWFRNGQFPLDASIQYGEVVGDSRHSLLIRPDGKDSLRLIYQDECAGKTHLAIRHQHIGRRRPPAGAAIERLVYRTYWTRREDTAVMGYSAQTTRLVRIDAAGGKA